jgi:hypothetical protein
MYGDHIDIRSGDIHSTVGGYPGTKSQNASMLRSKV